MSSKGKSSAETGGGSALVPRLRFPEFGEDPAWEMKPLSAGLDYLQPTPYLVSDTNYSPAYTTPVLTAGKTFILGYTNEEHGIFCEELPVIIFDDFTTASQFVDFPFKAKSSAMKILQAKNGSNIKFMFEALQMLSFEVGAHERHWISVFAPMLVAVPNPLEQQKIAECLDSADALIEAQGRKVEALKAHKKGLMQQLFPQEGETQPRLRFPEFEGTGEWEEKRLDKLATVQSGATPSKTNAEFWGGSIPWVSAKDMKRLFLEDSEDHISEAAVSSGARLVPEGTLLLLTRGMTLIKDVPICVASREMSFNQDVKGLRTRTGVNGLFLAWLLLGNKERLLDLVSIAGHGTGKIDTDELNAFTLLIPHPPEQQRIADCLTSLDDHIVAEARKLDTLKTHKKGLMQQLFPQMGEAI